MITRNRHDEREVLCELAGGSESAFVRIFDQYSPKVYSIASKFLDSRESAEEVVQDVFMDIWLQKEKMGEVLNLAAYLHGMTRRKVFDAFRRESAFKEILTELSYQEQAENMTERTMLENEYKELLHDAVRRLPELQQEIFRLAKEEGLSHEKIAEQLNLSRLAVKAQMKRILRSIRLQLEPFLRTELLVWLLLLWKK